MSRRIDEATARAAFARAVAGTQEGFGDFFLARLLGLEITYPGDACEVTFDAADFLFNPQGTLHGGILATALDVAMGHLINRQNGSPGTTLEMKIQYLAPIRTGRVTCRGEALRRGGTWFLRAEARDAEDTLLAFATSTWKLLKRAAPDDGQNAPCVSGDDLTYDDAFADSWTSSRQSGKDPASEPPARASPLSPSEIRAAAEAIGWSMRQLATRIGYDESTVRLWLRGGARVPPDVAAWLLRQAERITADPPPIRSPREETE